MKTDVLVVPNDSLLIGNDVAFTLVDSWAGDRKLSPPSSTFVGAMRSLYLSKHCTEGWDAYGRGCIECKKHTKCDAEAVAGSKVDPPASVALRVGPALLAREVAGRIEPLYPVPGDLLVEPSSKDAIRVQPSYLEPLAADLVTHDLRGMRLLAPSTRNPKAQAFNAYLTRKGMKVWAERSVQKPQTLQEEEHYVLPRRLYDTEQRVGLARGTSRGSASDGLFYGGLHARMKPGVGFLVPVEVPDGRPDLGLPATIAFGGDRRTVRVESAQVPMNTLEVKAKKRWRLSTVMPLAIGHNGLPAWVDAEKLTTVAPLPEGGKLVAIACRSHERVGGFDMQAKTPRPTSSFFPAGTTLFLEFEEAIKIEPSTEFFAGGY